MIELKNTGKFEPVFRSHVYDSFRTGNSPACRLHKRILWTLILIKRERTEARETMSLPFRGINLMKLITHRHKESCYWASCFKRSG